MHDMVSNRYFALYSDGRATWFAMEDGVLKKTRRSEQDHTSILPYFHISSIVTEYRSYHKLIYLGIGSIVFAIMELLLFLVKDSIPEMLNGVNLPFLIAHAQWGFVLFIVLLGFSLLLILGGILYKEMYYRFTGIGIDKLEWSMYSHRSRSKEDLIKFLNVVRDKMKESHSVSLKL